MDKHNWRSRPGRWHHSVMVLVSIMVASMTSGCSGILTKQQTYASPSAAVDALVAATRDDRSADIVRILGPEGKKLVYSGDAVADDAGRDRFVGAYESAHSIQAESTDKVVLILGNRNWPFPIPIVRGVDGSWHFDTPAGEQEILDRRVGRNELNAIKVCRAFVDAQRDYAERSNNDNGVNEYARKFISDPGKHDGLYWPAEPGEPASPTGPLLARAHAEGYGEAESGGREPYHGYYYRMLMRQGAHAADGAYEYVVDGHMIGGFALVAFPAKYGNSGIMTFIVNQDGIVYQKNLGPDTAEIADRMQSFDPDPGWTKVTD